MRPKPTREWVMLELERLGVRVVSGRLGRKAGEEEEDVKKVGGKSNVTVLWSCASVRIGLAFDDDFRAQMISVCDVSLK